MKTEISISIPTGSVSPHPLLYISLCTTHLLQQPNPLLCLTLLPPIIILNKPDNCSLYLEPCLTPWNPGTMSHTMEPWNHGLINWTPSILLIYLKLRCYYILITRLIYYSIYILSLKPVWATDQQVKIFSIWVKNLRVI